MQRNGIGERSTIDRARDCTTPSSVADTEV